MERANEIQASQQKDAVQTHSLDQIANAKVDCHQNGMEIEVSAVWKGKERT